MFVFQTKHAVEFLSLPIVNLPPNTSNSDAFITSTTYVIFVGCVQRNVYTRRSVPDDVQTNIAGQSGQQAGHLPNNNSRRRVRKSHRNVIHIDLSRAADANTKKIR